MNKIALYSAAIIILSSCAHVKTDKEVEEGYRLDYQAYSCPQLHQKYEEFKTHIEQEKKSRQNMNTVNTAVGVLGMINGKGTVNYNSESASEKNDKIAIKAIEKLAIDKQCEGVTFK